MNRLLMRTM